MKFSRRSFLQQASAFTAANLLLPSLGRDWVFANEIGKAPHYFVLEAGPPESREQQGWC